MARQGGAQGGLGFRSECTFVDNLCAQVPRRLNESNSRFAKRQQRKCSKGGDRVVQRGAGLAEGVAVHLDAHEVVRACEVRDAACPISTG